MKRVAVVLICLSLIGCMSGETSALIDKLESQKTEHRLARNEWSERFQGSAQDRRAQEMLFDQQMAQIKEQLAAAEAQGEVEKGESMASWGSWVSSIAGGLPDAGGLGGIAALLLGVGGSVLKQRGERKAAPNA